MKLQIITMMTTAANPMHINKIRFWSGALFLLASLAIVGCGNNSDKSSAAVGSLVTVYKSPTCGCCSLWVEHLEDNGYKVQVEERNDVMPIKEKFGVPAGMGSCHTALVDGYVIEGHVPAQDIQRLLKERPLARGLAVPGMPIGSPGMEMGDRRDPYHVYQFADKTSEPSVFSSYHQPE